MMMARQEIYKEMEQTMGSVPGFFKMMPDSALELEWESMKREQMETPAISRKCQQLIGLGIAAAAKCRYSIFYHREMARLEGATDAEIGAAAMVAKETAGWSAYLQGLDYDYEKFKKEVHDATEHTRKMRAKMAA